ncbi:MAG: LysR family transcriptional regulator [Comamonadaceae bacterium]|nr:MAG: LysR family transcriptional regulator [Comamonadaceae bacterium]
MRANLHLQNTALRYFLEVADSGSVAEASARLHVAGSAISRQVASLESALGVPLFDRHSRGMVLNAAGEVLAAHARRAMLDADAAVEAIGSLRRLRSGRVRIACTEAFAHDVLPRAITGFRREHDGIDFELDLLGHAGIAPALRNGDADIAVTFSRAPERDIAVAFRQPGPVVALVGKDHPLARARTLTLARMASHPLALPAAGTMVRDMIDLACSRQQLLLRPVLTTNSMGAARGFVLHGGGIAVSGELSVREVVQAGLMKAIAITDPGLDLRDVQVQTLAGRSLPPAGAAFLAHLCEGLRAG